MGGADAGGATEADLEWLGASWVSPTELTGLIEEFDRVVTV
jgi:hypothetical protein